MAKKTQSTFDKNIKIEVVMQKEMTFAEYEKMRTQAISKGWKVTAYQIGFYSPGYKTELEK